MRSWSLRVEHAEACDNLATSTVVTTPTWQVAPLVLLLSPVVVAV